MLFQECGDKAGLRKLTEKPVYNTITIASLLKEALKPLLTAEEKISAKLVHLYCMAVKFLDQPMTADEMKVAFDSAHAADYDAMMTRVSTFILDPVYKIYIGWFVPAKDPMYITFEASFQHKVKYTRGK